VSLREQRSRIKQPPCSGYNRHPLRSAKHCARREEAAVFSFLGAAPTKNPETKKTNQIKNKTKNHTNKCKLNWGNTL
jgi:hypothetical protein